MLNYDELQVGDILSETQFYTITKKNGSGITVDTDTEGGIGLSKKYVEGLLLSAGQFKDTVKVTRTEMQKVLKDSPRIAMTVNFDTKVKEADVIKQIVDLYPNKGGKIKSAVTFAKEVKKVISIKGDNRTMIGRHHGHYLETGRLNFIDMELKKDSSKDYDTRSRQVDPRTLQWIIVNNTKYILK